MTHQSTFWDNHSKSFWRLNLILGRDHHVHHHDDYGRSGGGGGGGPTNRRTSYGKLTKFLFELIKIF